MSLTTNFTHKLILLFIAATLITGCEGVKKKIPDANTQFGQEVNSNFADDQGSAKKIGSEDSLIPDDDKKIAEEDISIIKEGTGDNLIDVDKEVFTLRDIHFQFDKSDLDSDSRTYLETMASWLEENRSLKISIEGHADDRGTSEYNLALGARRADSIKRYLEILGVESNRLSTISYGEEMPSQDGQNETAWSANRRVHFEGI